MRARDRPIDAGERQLRLSLRDQVLHDLVPHAADRPPAEAQVRHMIASIVRRSSSRGRAPRMFAAWIAASNFAHCASVRTCIIFTSDEQANQALRDRIKSPNANGP